MDPILHKAALTGNLILFKQAIASHINSGIDQYLLSQTTDDVKDNIIHVAAENGQEAFICEVMKKMQLSPFLVVALICQQNNIKLNPLHVAALKGHLRIVKSLIESYHICSKVASDEASAVPETRVTVADAEIDINQLPWLARAGYEEQTPLHMAIDEGHEEVASYILSQDMEKLCNTGDCYDRSPLYCAMEKGFEKIVVQILTSGCSYSLRCNSDNKTILHGASRITEQVATLLLDKHPELLSMRDLDGETFLHDWAHRGALQPLQCFLKSNIFTTWSAEYKTLLSHQNHSGDTHLHHAAFSNQLEVAKLLVDTYTQTFGQFEEPSHLPWLYKNSKEETPLLIALYHGNEDIAFYLLSLDYKLANICDSVGNSPLFLAMERGCAKVAKTMLDKVPSPLSYTSPIGRNPLHVSSRCPGIVDALVRKLGTKLIEMKDIYGKTPLDYAAASGDIEVTQIALNHSGTSSAPYAWIEACNRGHFNILRMFMNKCDFKKLHLEQRDTPVHHIQLKTREEYEEFMQIPVIEQLKNATDSDGATPLHRAIKRQDIIFVELLLGTLGINWTIMDNSGQTPLDFLAKLCDELPDWDAMSKRIGMNPIIKTTYIPLKMNLAEIRTTLSVVAALLATITFASGFTIPGGFNDHGYVIFARNAAFVVFLLSDTYAMCCSMLVLFILIWAMVCDPDESLVLIDRSIVILQQALYGTLVAFMTGVYTVVSHNYLWTAIVIIVMCSLVAVAANKNVLYKLLKRFIPPTR